MNRGRSSVARCWGGAVLFALIFVAPAGLLAQGADSQAGSAGSESNGDSGASESPEGAEDSKGSESDEATPVSTSDASSDEGSESETESSGSPEGDPREYCDGFMRTHGESAARKLYRALNGNDYTVERVRIGRVVTVEIPDADGNRSKVRFRVSLENEGRSAVLVAEDREYRRTLIAAMTSNGPIITSHQWPERSAITSRADCEPKKSWIEHPDVPADGVEIEPFDYWGVRVLWRIPTKFTESESSWGRMDKAVRDVLSDGYN